MTRYGALEGLTPEHDTSEFDCGSEAQTSWLRRHALQAQAAETAAVYVVCAADSRRVVAYFALSAGSVEPSAAPPRVTRGTGRYPVPVILLARLGIEPAVDRRRSVVGQFDGCVGPRQRDAPTGRAAMGVSSPQPSMSRPAHEPLGRAGF